MKAVVAAFNQEKALVGAFSVIVQLHWLIVYSTRLWGRAKTPTFPQSQLRLGCGEPPCRLAALCREFRQFVVFNCDCEYSSRIMFECWKLNPSLILVLPVLHYTKPVSTKYLLKFIWIPDLKDKTRWTCSDLNCCWLLPKLFTKHFGILKYGDGRKSQYLYERTDVHP